MARIGYARVSTLEQDWELQVRKLTAEGCSIIRSEKVSGAKREGRVELATIIDFLRPNDELMVTRLDRLGRHTRDVPTVTQARLAATRPVQRAGIEVGSCVRTPFISWRKFEIAS